MIHSIVAIPLIANAKPQYVLPAARWSEGRWNFIDSDKIEAAVNLISSELPPTIEKLLQDENRVHVDSLETNTKIGRHSLKAVEFVSAPIETEVLGPVLILHLDGPDTAGVSALAKLVPLKQQAMELLSSVGVAVAFVDQRQRALAVTTAKLKDSSLPVVEMPDGFTVREFLVRTVLTEIVIISSLQETASFSLRKLIPTSGSRRNEIDEFLSTAIFVRNEIWWKHVTSNALGKAVLRKVRNLLDTDVQMEELLDLARGLREYEDLRAARGFNQYGFALALSAIVASWVSLSSQPRWETFVGLGSTVIALTGVWIYRKGRKSG